MMRLSNRTAVVLHDLLMVVLAWQFTWLARFNFSPVTSADWKLSLYILPLVIVIQGIISFRFGLYRGLWRFASLPDLWNIFRASVLGALLITLFLFLSIRLESIPRSILILYPIFLIFFLGGPRLAYRLWKDHSLSLKKHPGHIQSILIIGAGYSGDLLVREMLRDGYYYPVGLLDDNLALKNSELHGIPVLGVVSELKTITQRYDVDNIVIAIPSATDEQMQKIVNICEEVDIPLRTLPKLQDMVSGKSALATIRDVSIEDLLGREKIELDWKVIQQGITNKVILVTGGGGSIGSELCHQIAQLNPSELIVFEHSEFNLYKIQSEIGERYSDLSLRPVLGSICDRDKVEHVLEAHKPDIIFHAAAYKHVPILQDELREGVQNNILGTKNLAEAAIKNGCLKFVFISTDKAVNPGNVLGATKRVAEIYCDGVNKVSDTRFITVRFGNVLGSTGSVVPLFRKQIKNGGPITVTHPETTRYFMTIPEASQLILQASAIGKGGEIFVLDMGQPVKIAYLAEQMIKLSGLEVGSDVKIEFIGLRPGEKLHEELFYGNEKRDKTSHDKILFARHNSVDWDSLNDNLSRLSEACNEFDDDKLVNTLNAILFDLGLEQNKANNLLSFVKR